MNIYVKEFKDIITLKSISIWVKKEISLLPFASLTDVKANDIIIISNFDTTFSKEDLSDYTFLIYEDFLDKIKKNIIQEYNYNYDYYYLKNALIQACDPNVTTIIAGSSYGLFGIDSSMLTHEVNLSLSSQDLYYSLKGIYQVCNNNSNIQNIVLCMGYYDFFCDLSKTQNVDEIQRVAQVYNPLYLDVHNCTLLPPK